MEATLEMEYIEKRSGITDVSIINNIQEMEDRISGEDILEGKGQRKFKPEMTPN